MHSRTRLQAIAALALAAAFLAGCGSAPPATPSPSTPAATPVAVATGTPTPLQTPSPSPSPTAAPDVAKLFAAKLASATFAAGGPLSGTLAVGNFEGTITGSAAFLGKDSGLDMTIDVAKLYSKRTSQVSVGGRKFASEDGGPWFETTESGNDNAPMSAAFGVALATASDVGVVDKNGRQLHHLAVPSGTISAAMLGMTDASMLNPQAAIDFYATDDGTLAVMSMALSYSMTSGGATLPASMTIDFTMDQPPAAGSIQIPEVVWTRYTSKVHRYTIGYPVDWELVPAKKATNGDVFAYSSAQLAVAIREVQPKAAADNLRAYVRAFIAATPKTKFVVNEAVTVGTRDAWRIAYYRKVNGTEMYFVHTLMIKGRNAYSIAMVIPKGYETEATAFHELQVSTFTMP